MNNIVEYILQLRDQMSSGLMRVGQNADKVLANVDKRSGKATKSINELNARIDELTRTRNLSINTSQIRQASREIARLEQQRDRLSGGGSGSKGGGMGLMVLMGNPYVQGIMAAGAAIGSLGALSAKKESSITGLSTFIGKDQAKQAYANIQKDADVTPYGVDSLLTVNRALISAGLNAKEARQDTMNLANAISAVGGGDDVLERMAANMQQIKTVGKATEMDIKQFAMTGINIYEVLARATGKNIEQVKEMNISYDLLAYSLDKAAQKGGLFENSLATQSETLGGKWSTLVDSAKGAATELGDALSPYLKIMINWASETIENYRDIFRNMGALMTNARVSLSAQWEQLGLDILYKLKMAGIGILKWADGIGNDIANTISDSINGLTAGAIDLGHADANPMYAAMEASLTETKKFQEDYNKAFWSQKKADYVIHGLKTAEGTPSSSADRKWNFKAGGSGNDEESKKNKAAVAKSVDTITGGGVRNMYVSLGKFQDQLNIHVGSIKEGVDAAQEQLEDMLLRVLNSAGSAQN